MYDRPTTRSLLEHSVNTDRIPQSEAITFISETLTTSTFSLFGKATSASSSDVEVSYCG